MKKNMKQIKLYFIRNETNSNIIGHFQQLEAPVGKKYNPKSKYNFHELDSRKFMDSNPELDIFGLHKYSEVTDFLGSHLAPRIGFFFNDKVKKILEAHIIKGGRIYEVEIQAKAEVLSYYFLHLIHDYYEIIDFPKSKFENFVTNEKVSFDTEQEEISPYIKPKEIVFKNVPDIFRAPYDINVLISENLKDVFVSNNIKGINIEEYKYIKFYTTY
jgi:hypothetical protein